MIYIVDKEGRVVGSASGPINEEDLAVRGEMALESDLVLPPSRVVLVSKKGQAVVAEKPAPKPQARLVLSTTARDDDGDGLPDIVASGRSKASITAQILDHEDKVVDEPLVVTFRTTGGALSRRSLTIEDGKAVVSLASSRETVGVTVTASAEGCLPGRLDLEFIPPK